MNYRYILTLLLFTLLLHAHSQESDRKFGKCSTYELELSECSFDPGAGAMVIYDQATLSFHHILGYSLDRTMKIKIFSKAGFNSGNFSIQYHKDNKITNLKGNTYNLVDGKIVKTPLNTKQTFEEQVIDEVYSKNIAMPDIREGSVIELSYRRMDISPAFMPTWYFQRNIPVLYSEFNAILNPIYEYRHQVSGEIELDSYSNLYTGDVPVTFLGKKYFHSNRKFVMSEIPAFTDRSFITCEDDYMSRVEFQIVGHNIFDKFESVLSSWTEVIDQLLLSESFGDFLKDSEREGKKFVGTIASLSDLDKAIRIDEHMKATYRYNEENSYLTSEQFSKINSIKEGNCTDLNLTAIGMFRAAGIEATPVMLSTRDHGKIYPVCPFLNAFNYVIGLVRIDQTYYLLDVTEPLLKFGELPTMCLNDQGLIVERDMEDWIDFKSSGTSDKMYLITLTPTANMDSLTMQCNLTSTYYEALEQRKDYINDYESLAKKLMGPEYKLYDSIQCTNLKEPELPFEMAFTTATPMGQIDNHLIIDPFCGYIPSENPFKEAERRYPVDFIYNWSRTFSTTLHIPEGYKLSTKPENLIINDPNIRVVYTISEREPGVLNIMGLYHFKKDLYQSTEYQALKGYYDQIISKFNENITLEKVESLSR